MTITLNHTIVPAKDKNASADFFARMFGVPRLPALGHFAPVRVNDTLTLDFDERGNFEHHHYAFHVSDEEFDAIFKRVLDAGLTYWSEPTSKGDMKINTRHGGRGVYFADPNGHSLELLTRP